MKKQIVNNVKDFFRFKEDIIIQENVQMMEFTVDLTIGSDVVVEYDDGSIPNIERMQKIALSRNTDEYQGLMSLWGKNNYREVTYEVTHYQGFTIFDVEYITFIRVRDIHSLAWIPFVYECYQDYQEGLFEPMTTPIKYSGDLENTPIVM